MLLWLGAWGRAPRGACKSQALRIGLPERKAVQWSGQGVARDSTVGPRGGRREAAVVCRHLSLWLWEARAAELPVWSN